MRRMLCRFRTLLSLSGSVVLSDDKLRVADVTETAFVGAVVLRCQIGLLCSFAEASVPTIK